MILKTKLRPEKCHMQVCETTRNLCKLIYLLLRDLSHETHMTYEDAL